jgi:hypothetical protein
LDNSFWFAGGDSSCEGIEPVATGGHLVVKYEYPSDGNDKVALRFDPPFDASEYSGVQFTVRADREIDLRIEVASQDTGLHLLQNADDWKSSSPACSVRLSSEERTFRFTFASFKDAERLLAQYPDVTPGVNTHAIWEIQFFPECSFATIEIVDIIFYTDP